MKNLFLVRSQLIDGIKKRPVGHHRGRFWSLLFLFGFTLSQARSAHLQFAGTADTAAVHALIERLLPGKSPLFKLEVLPSGAVNDSFLLESKGDNIIIKGTSALAMCKAFNYYLSHYCHTAVSWYAADPVTVPQHLPAVATPVSETCRFENRFFLNYCTFGYTTLWWKWNDWGRFCITA